eukprot:TRINITY_DN29512_c0_g1_i2.p1 TRINITY_DN29512_c0_g1~~TRINITY_DN29512_c0_g1_i2.p1  ORF type:complete len:159 (-),score=19.84 TRINITY_DN29512_c0_g1_i2:1011-1487(-)
MAMGLLPRDAKAADEEVAEEDVLSPAAEIRQIMREQAEESCGCCEKDWCGCEGCSDCLTYLKGKGVAVPRTASEAFAAGGKNWGSGLNWQKTLPSLPNSAGVALPEILCPAVAYVGRVVHTGCPRLNGAGRWQRVVHECRPSGQYRPTALPRQVSELR